MKLGRIDILASLLIVAASCIFTAEAFLFPARPATFDGPIHITSMAQFHSALKDGDFPVYWTDGVANYGLPLSIVAHQLTNYSGGLLTFMTGDPYTSYILLSFLGIVLSGLSLYGFLRIYFPAVPSLAGVILFSFSTYKIINFYIRGAMPETFSAVFLPLMLSGMYLFIAKRNIAGFFLIILSSFFLAITHPMMLVIYAFIYLPYAFFLLFMDWRNEQKQRPHRVVMSAVVAIGALLLGVGLASYYIIPLQLEIKYFYFGLTNNHLVPNNFLSFESYFSTPWSYFTQSEIFTRGHTIHAGIVESILMVAGLCYVVWKVIKSKQFTLGILEFALLVGAIVVTMTTQVSAPIYNLISPLGNIQFPWRMLSAFIFLPPIICAFFLTKFNRPVLPIAVILLILLIQLPQVFGKNFVHYSTSSYYFTTHNIHSVMMNTIWSGKTEEYPARREKADIVMGSGEIVSRTERNSSRNYIVTAITPLRMVDYTFYFPGWKVYVDGQNTPIEFQDPKYRGVITYAVPEGNHEVSVVFEDTKIRLYAKILTLFFLAVFISLVIFRKRVAALIT